MARLILPRLLSDGCVIQRRKSIHIWGWDDAGSEITVNLAGETVTGSVTTKEGLTYIFLRKRAEDLTNLLFRTIRERV